MRFNFHRFAIFAFFAFLNSQLLGTVVFKYSQTTDVLLCLKMTQGCCNAIFSGITGDLGFLSLCDGLVILAPFHRPMATDSLCSAAATRIVLSTPFRTAFTNNLLQIWNDVALGYQVRTNRHVLRGCPVTNYHHLVMHDVIDWLKLCT